MTRPSSPRPPTLLESLVPVVGLMVFLAAAVIDVAALPPIAGLTPLLQALVGLPWIGSVLQVAVPTQVPLAGAVAVAALMAWRLGWGWRDIEESFLDGIRLSLGACLILLVVGMLIGTWIAGGIVPMFIVYGLELISARHFLVAACVICCVVSLATGSSWTTAGTVGIALIGIGHGLGLPPAWTAGAIISGAYFGDKMSPLSDTTNLAPAVAGAGLFEHVRHMVATTAPSLTIALILYAWMGHRHGAEATDLTAVRAIADGLRAKFAITPWLLVAPAAVFGLVLARVPALPALFVGALLGGGCAGVFQGRGLGEVLVTAYGGFKAETGVRAVDDLLTRGGMESMYGTIGIILCAMCFGGVMEKSGMLGVLAGAILRRARGAGGLIAATLGTAVGVNVLAPDQYLSLVVPGRMYRTAYRDAGLHPKNLSRALEDAGTLTSPLVPWNSCGAYMHATLGVFPFAYLPFAFFNLINPCVSLLYGYLGWTITRLPPSSAQPPSS